MLTKYSHPIYLTGKNINYDGDIDDEEEILDWLTLPDNMEMTDHIEQVNRKMFQKIRQTSDYLAVFFCNFFSHFAISSWENAKW